MILSQKIAAALDENTHALTPPCVASVDDGRNLLTLHLTAVDAVGLAFDSLEVKSRQRDHWSDDDIKSWGDRLSKRVTYLMEPLKVVELDTTEGELQLRSEKPTLRAEKRGYYEVRILRDGSLSLKRYLFDEQARSRAQAPCQMTREVLERLADDIIASIP